MGIDENAFLTWLEGSPQFLAWIPTLFRLKSAQTGDFSIIKVDIFTMVIDGGNRYFDIEIKFPIMEIDVSINKIRISIIMEAAISVMETEISIMVVAFLIMEIRSACAAI